MNFHRALLAVHFFFAAMSLAMVISLVSEGLEFSLSTVFCLLSFAINGALAWWHFVILDPEAEARE